MKSIMLYLSLLFSASISAQSVDWFETIGVKNPTSGSSESFTLSALSTEDSVVYVGASLARSNFAHFYSSRDSLKLYRDYPFSASSFVAQYTADGRFRWARALGSRNSYLNQKMVMTSRNGAVYAAVLLTEAGLIGLDSIGNRDGMSFLLVKFDKNGREVWRNISNSFYWLEDGALGKLLVDDNDNLYFAGDLGHKFRALSFDNVSTKLGGNQFVFRFDANGKAQEVYTLEAPKVFNGSVKDLQKDDKGNIFLMLNSGARNVSSSCAYAPWETAIFRLDAARKATKVATFNCTDILTANSLGIAENGDFLVAGRYRGTIEVERWRSPTVACQTVMGFVLRLSAQGRFVWFKDSPNKNEYSDNYHILREKEGNWLVAGYQRYGTDDPNISYRYPNIDLKYPRGKARIVVRRLSPMGVQLDSVAHYVQYVEQEFSNILLAQNSRKTYLTGRYDCYFDSLSASTCYRDGFKESMGSKIFVAQISDKVLTNRRLSTPIMDSSVFSVLPNPTTGNVLIRTDRPIDTDADLRVSDMSGRLVLQRNLEKGQFIYSLNLDDLSSGVYVMSIKSKDNVWVTKITKI